MLEDLTLENPPTDPPDWSTNVTISDAGIDTNGKTHGKTNEAKDNKRKNSREVQTRNEARGSQWTADTDTLAKKRKM